MTHTDILLAQSCKLNIELSHQCKTENGIEHDEEFKIIEILGAFEQLVIENQYGQKVTVNPNQVELLITC